MSTNLNLEVAGSRGDFSGGRTLAEAAMRELGDAEASYFVTSQQNRFKAYLNRVVTDVNRHPMFLDLLDTAYDDQVGSMTNGSQVLTLVGPTVTFNTYTPVRVAGAGYLTEVDGTPATTQGDLYSFVVKQNTDASGNTIANSWVLADECGSNSVANTVVAHPYKARIKRYSEISTDNFRAIDDEVMILGIKSYFMKDDSDTNNAGLITLAQNEYTTSINSWLGSIVNIQGSLTVEISEYT